MTTIRNNAAPDNDFYALLIGAALLAIGGIFLDSVPVLIASMIVAPLSSPIFGMGLGIIAQDARLALRSFAVLIASFIVAFGLGAGATILWGGLRTPDAFISFDPNWFLAAAVAAIAGCVGAYGMISPKVANSLIGVAIAVSLMPPLVETGIAVASRQPAAAYDALTLFLINVICILLASTAVFGLFGLGRAAQSVR